MSEKATVLVSEVKKVKEGEGDYGPWTLYHLIDSDERKWPTFSRPLAKEGQALEGKWAELGYEENDRGPKWTSIKETTKPENGTGNYREKLGTGDYVTGQSPPIKSRQIFASTAANCAAALAGQFVGRMPQQEWTPSLICAFYDSLENHIFTQLLRRGKIMEDSDIQFMPGYEPPA